MAQKRSFWGWGYEDYQLDEKAVDGYKALLSDALGIEKFRSIPIPNIEQCSIRKSRFVLAPELEAICTDDPLERAQHTYGKSFRDVWRGANGIFDNPPDYIAYPRTEDDIMRLYEFAQKANVSIIPYGGGSSVSGGVEPTKSNRYNGVITVDI